MSPRTLPHPDFGFPQLDPLPDAGELRAYYESKYYDPLRKSAAGSNAPGVVAEAAARETEADRAWRAATEHADLAAHLDELAPGRRVLDVGAGTGELVESLSARGFDAAGIDPSREASELARSLGRNVAASDLNAYWGDGGHHRRFDATCLMNVLEHVPDPARTLRQCRDLLDAGGIVVIRSPNDFSEIQAAAVAKLGLPQWWVTAPDHVSYFSQATLAKLLTSCGLDVVRSTCDFPIDWFLLMGWNYVADPSAGARCHELRRSFEAALPGPLRRKIYAALAGAGCGRNLVVYARKREL